MQALETMLQERLLRKNQYLEDQRSKEVNVRNAVSKLRPAGPPPTQTTSNTSGCFWVSVAKLLRNRSFLIHDGQM